MLPSRWLRGADRQLRAACRLCPRCSGRLTCHPRRPPRPELRLRGPRVRAPEVEVRQIPRELQRDVVVRARRRVRHRPRQGAGRGGGGRRTFGNGAHTQRDTPHHRPHSVESVKNAPVLGATVGTAAVDVAMADPDGATRPCAEPATPTAPAKSAAVAVTPEKPTVSPPQSARPTLERP